MFRWSHDAALCYVYLWNVSVPIGERGHLPSRCWESAFRASRWFTRDWTLQELLAPKSVQFFAQEGTLLGDKVSLQQQIHELIGVAVPALRGDSLALFNIEERFKWAESCPTRRGRRSRVQLSELTRRSPPYQEAFRRVQDDFCPR